MKKIVVVAAMAILSMTYGASWATAQGPQGAGAGAAAASSGSGSGHSFNLNPVKWVKKEPKPASDQLDAKAEQDKKLTSNLQAQGVLPANTDAKAACENFKALDECVAALHVSKNLSLDWNCLKSNLTGVQTSADMSGCKGSAGTRAMSLRAAVQAMKPDADAKGASKTAEKQAKDDLKAAGV
ncbi:MAG TPA: hypothetical protein VE077_17775 [Candidatus Methylomirabilis sp.]|nr:hypothetical protein [Candidatus Methylomirabilis sp.]